MVFFGVIADDFTGSCDTGVQFRKLGKVRVINYSWLRECRIDNVNVVIVNTQSRLCSPADAYVRVKSSAEALKLRGGVLVYKKIDSTLRGNIGHEIEALLEASTYEHAIVAPAYPANKRVTINGVQLIDGVPVHETEFSEDPLNPVKESNIKRLIERQSNLKTCVIPLKDVRSGDLQRLIEDLILDGYKVLVADAETERDLEKIASIAIKMRLLPCGSAGLAEKISNKLLLYSKHRSGILIISGSIKKETVSQVRYLERRRMVSVLTPEFYGVLNRLDSTYISREAERVSEEASKILARGENVAVTLVREKIMKGVSKEVFRKTAEHLLTLLGLIAARTLKKSGNVLGLILIGGETSYSVLEALKASGLDLTEEILPGMPVGRIIGGRYEGLNVITKAGGFGEENYLETAIRKLKEGA